VRWRTPPIIGDSDGGSEQLGDHKAMDGRRISVRLDPGMLLERLVLEGLAAIPKSRQQDWVRSLVVQGFLAESRVLRQVQKGSAVPANETVREEKPAGLPPSAYANWLRQPAKRPASSRRAVAETTRHSPTPGVPRDGGKPFTQLAKVIG